MSRKSRKRENQRVKQRRLYNANINSIIRSEPIIRVHDRRRSHMLRNRENVRRRRIAMRKEFDRINAPKRFTRRVIAEGLVTAFGLEAYHKFHNCRKEWRKLLSWRSGQGAGRKRSQRELRNNHSTFIKKDC